MVHHAFTEVLSRINFSMKMSIDVHCIQNKHIYLS